MKGVRPGDRFQWIPSRLVANWMSARPGNWLSVPSSLIVAFDAWRAVVKAVEGSVANHETGRRKGHSPTGGDGLAGAHGDVAHGGDEMLVPSVFGPGSGEELLLAAHHDRLVRGRRCQGAQQDKRRARQTASRSTKSHPG